MKCLLIGIVCVLALGQAESLFATEVPSASIDVRDWKVAKTWPKGVASVSGEIFVVPAIYSSELTIKLQRNGGAVAGTVLFLRARDPIWGRPELGVPFAIPINEDMPEGAYELQVVSQAGQTITGNTAFDIVIGKSREGISAEKLLVSGSGKNWKVSFPKPCAQAGVLEVWFHNEEGLLMAAASYPFEPGIKEVVVKLPEVSRWNSVKAGALSFHIGGGNVLSDPVHVKFQASVTAHHKPMGHGIYEESTGVKNYWHAADDHSLFWNGVPWIPYGGMYYLYAAKPTLKERQVEQKKMDDTLDIIQKFGFNDLYVNADVGLRSPDWYIQTVVDDFNARGIRFGWQLTTGAKPFEAYQIFSSVSQGLTKAVVSRPGILNMELPLLNINSLLIVPADGKGLARRVPFSIQEKIKADGLEIIQILESTNNAKKKSFEIKVDGLAPGQYYVLINTVEQGKRVSNVWERLEETKSGLEWISRIDWGPGLRFFVDPICNEEGINNRYEVIRVWSKAFNAEFEEWLKTKYAGSLNALESAWCLPKGRLESFAMAARLVPIRDLDNAEYLTKLTLVDPETGFMASTQGGEGVSWLDYLRGVRELYGRKRDEIAKFLKTRVNVPVVMKRVSPWMSLEGISRIPGGIDGIGMEIYPESGSGTPYGALSGRAESDLSLQTTWLLATELGYSAKPGNREIQSWPDKQIFRRVVRETYSAGARGFYLFGWRLPGKEWVNHILTNQLDRMQWARDIFNELETKPPVQWAQYGVAFPEGQSWWWKSNQISWTRYNCVYAEAPSAFNQSVALKVNGEDQLWAVSSNTLINAAEPVVLNLSNAFYVDYYANEINGVLDQGKKVIYLGHWPSGTEKLPALARHFIPGKRMGLAGGGEIQPLQVFPGDKVLMKDANGNVWSKLSGNLLIVSASPVMPVAYNTSELPRFLKSEWVDLLLGNR